MIALLNVIGVVVLVAGIILFVAMLQSNLTREPEDEQRPKESPPDKPAE